MTTEHPESASQSLPERETSQHVVRSVNTAPPLPEPPPPLVEVHKPLRATAWLWRLIALIAVAEVSQHFVIQSRVVPEADWRQAAQYFRDHAAANDGALVVPEWADPIFRNALGERADLNSVGAQDGAAWGSLWVFSIRGFALEESPRFAGLADTFVRTPTSQQHFGRLSLAHYPRAPEAREADYQFLAHYREAHVRLWDADVAHECPLSFWPWSGGGLGGGPAAESERHVCDRGRPWLFVGPVVLNDLALLPRHCLWQHPQGQAPVETTFPAVPLRSHMRFYGGIHYENERDLDKGDVIMRVRIAGQDVGSMVHRDGDGWKGFDVDVAPEWVGTAQDVSISTASDAPYLRTFCWNGYTYARPAARAP